ncbi:recombinase [Muribaculaceae bacterium Z1]|nr:recombinase [Muribaculaceae bacterium S4]NBI19498.1 recombinase [Muribaculaceae bacterium Z1]
MTQPTKQQPARTAPTPQTTAPAKKSPVNILSEMLNRASMKRQFEDTLKAGAATFIASMLELYGSDSKLQLCDPGQVCKEALKAAALRLPINKALGQAYIIAYNNTVTDEHGNKVKRYEPTFQIGYKGLYQLAMRTGQYRIINADVVYEGELRKKSKLTGEIDLDGEKTSDKVIGYFAYIELLNGYHKALYMSVEEIAIHAKRYSKAIKGNRDVTVQSLMELSKLPVVADSGSLGWLGNFHGMAIKTVLRNLLSKYGYLSVELQQALDSDDGAATQSVVKAPTADTAGVATAQAVDATTVEYEDITPAPAEVESEEAQVIECGF